MIVTLRWKKQNLFAIFSGINKHILTNTLYKVNNLVNYLSILNTLILYSKSINHVVATRTKI